MKKIRQTFSTSHFRHGSYSVIISAVVIAIVIVINLLAAQLPASIKSIDISAQKLYTTGDVTQEIVDGLTHDVQIHLIAQESGIDSRILNFVEHYVSLSPRLSYDIIDPVLHPSVLETYGVSENSVVVECADTQKTASFSFSDVVVYDQMSYYYYGQMVETEFDGEGQLTSAVNEVTNDIRKKLYLLEGHGELLLGSSVSQMLDKQNFETASLNLLTEQEIPADCDLLMINGATSDIADDEKKLLEDYMASGGNVMIVLGETMEHLPHLESILGTCGITVADGYIADTERFYQNSMFYIFPEFVSGNGVTGSFDSDELALIINARGFTVEDAQDEKVTVDSFMTTSSNGYAVVDENNQTQGTYVLGAVAEKSIDDDTKSHLIVLGTPTLFDDQIVQAFPSLVNLDVFMDAATAGFEDVNNISIAAKSLEVANNTITGGRLYGMIFIAVIPIVVLVCGLIHWIGRRKA